MRNKFLSFVCFIYSFIILYVYVSGKLENFLARNMQIYILISCPVLLIIGICLLYFKSDYKFKIIDLFLFIPLCMIILSGNGRLTTSFANNRNINFSRFNSSKKSIKSDIIDNKKVELDISDYDFSVVDYDVVDEAYSALSDELTYSRYPEKLIGKTIRVSGFVLKDDKIIPKGYYGIGKYIISCCAADAGFGGFIFKYNGNYKIQDNKWYEIEGVFENDYDVYNQKIAVINVVNIKKIDASSQKIYVYPCYSYGDGSCDILKNYELMH